MGINGRLDSLIIYVLCPRVLGEQNMMLIGSQLAVRTVTQNWQRMQVIQKTLFKFLNRVFLFQE